MATRRTTKTQPEPEGPLLLKISREEAKSRIEDRIEKGRLLRQRQISNAAEFDELQNEYYKWDSFNNLLLKQVFTNESLAKEYSFWGVSTIPLYEQSLGHKIAEVHGDIDLKCRRLDSIAERLELIPLEGGTAAEEAARAAIPTRSNKVFIVHGHDEIAKTNLEVFVRENGLEPVVLHRQADEGQTIIEKFEKHSDVGYAFILLTPDEVAYLAGEDKKPDEERKKERRARPNVIFEFGYFVGKLGRSKVCCLHTGDVALPSDVSGMIYKAYSKNIEEVAYSILKDLKAAGYRLS